MDPKFKVGDRVIVNNTMEDYESYSGNQICDAVGTVESIFRDSPWSDPEFALDVYFDTPQLFHNTSSTNWAILEHNCSAIDDSVTFDFVLLMS